MAPWFSKFAEAADVPPQKDPRRNETPYVGLYVFAYRLLKQVVARRQGANWGTGWDTDALWRSAVFGAGTETVLAASDYARATASTHSVARRAAVFASSALLHATFPQWEWSSLGFALARVLCAKPLKHATVHKHSWLVYIFFSAVFGYIGVTKPAVLDRSYSNFLCQTAGYTGRRHLVELQEKLPMWCEWQHPGISCPRFWLQHLCYTWKRVSAMYGILYVCTWLFRGTSSTQSGTSSTQSGTPQFDKIAQAVLRSSLFLSLHTLLSFNSPCLFHRCNMTPRRRLLLVMVGCAIASLSIFFEQPARRTEVTFLLAFRCIEAVVRWIVSDYFPGFAKASAPLTHVRNRAACAAAWGSIVAWQFA